LSSDNGKYGTLESSRKNLRGIAGPRDSLQTRDVNPIHRLRFGRFTDFDLAGSKTDEIDVGIHPAQSSLL
jgi:hypothetical protein